MSSAEELARRLIEEGFNNGDLSVADDVISPDQVEHQYYGPDHAPGSRGRQGGDLLAAGAPSRTSTSPSTISSWTAIRSGSG